MTRTDIMISDREAMSKAKSDFANILGISRNSVRTGVDSYSTRRYGSTICVCGETRALFLEMTNAGKRQLRLLEKTISRPGAVMMYGICPNCGCKH